MRHRGASIFIYLIFGILIAVFVINFGPQGGQGGCRGVTNAVIDVDDSSANLTAYRVAYSNPFNPGRSRERTYFALDTLIRRELLADAAAERGLRANADMVQEAIKRGEFFVGGLRIPIKLQIFDQHDDGTQTFNYQKFKGWISGLDVRTPGTYYNEQKRALQATMMYELLVGSVRVSREEALNAFLYSTNTVTYDTVTFSPSAYRAAMRLTDADIERFLTTHGDDVKARYTADEVTYKGRKPELKLRQIFVEAEPPAAPPPAPPAPAPDDKAGSAAGSAATADAKPADPKPAADAPKVGDAAKKKLSMADAKAKLETARAQIAAGKLKFPDAVKQLSTDEAQKANGGAMGWRSVENAQLGDLAVNDAVKALKPGEMTPVITTDAGAFLVMAEDKREGDLTYDQVKAEIAAELARDVWSKEAAKRAALAAIEQARAGKKLDELFEREAAPANDGMDWMNDPNLSDEQKKMIFEQIRQQQMGGKTGRIEFETKDEPAAWKAGDGAGNEGGSSATGSAAPAEGSATTDSKVKNFKIDARLNMGSAAGSAAGSATTPTTTPTTPATGGATPAPAAPAPVEASKDALPSFGDVPKPKVSKQGPHPRMAALPGLPKEATAVLFDELSEGDLAKQVYDADGSYVLVQLSSKVQPKVEDFEKEADRYISQLQLVRGYSFAEDWLEKRCEQLTKENKIVPAKELVTETDDKGNPVPQVYRPCMFGTQWLNAMLTHTRR